MQAVTPVTLKMSGFGLTPRQCRKHAIEFKVKDGEVMINLTGVKRVRDLIVSGKFLARQGSVQELDRWIKFYEDRRKAI